MLFTSGDTVKQISVTIISDDIVEKNEVFTLSLSTSAGSPLTVGTPGVTQITINDDDGMHHFSLVYIGSNLDYAWCPSRRFDLLWSKSITVILH